MRFDLSSNCTLLKDLILCHLCSHGHPRTVTLPSFHLCRDHVCEVREVVRPSSHCSQTHSGFSSRASVASWLASPGLAGPGGLNVERVDVCARSAKVQLMSARSASPSPRPQSDISTSSWSRESDISSESIWLVIPWVHKDINVMTALLGRHHPWNKG